MAYRDIIKPLNLNIDGAKHFKWKEALYLREWNYYALPNADISENIISLASKLDLIREYFRKPVLVTSWYRPREYNKYIGSKARNSPHIVGKAVDFVVKDIDSDEVREALVPKLAHWEIRMEKLLGASWVHIDINEVISNRYFKP